ncbi:indole-3-glycerol phosphate synthase TrpC [Acetobacterium woodii]|uniref:Indole-3-glycerol phosphate synthase n=1 Tax=Acetobacterium woodii (strain ATCC 29683 / DSM 1030 / JCM 2381 / KCTC 1655 / WB1) TaxID=931626 RepID=H6LKM3_ACEWD|nr:indole-3-glycerol phosphate synthase TrpC [Acetobacterium woodii]AFA48815.1 indole-3-glycerol phosphate synthase TrpC [Acetobacterium woodii DSM 1030]
MILDQIVTATKKRVADLKKASRIEFLKSQIKLAEPPFAFEKALAGEAISFICEVKKASPSKGIIAEAFPFLEIARDYQDAGAQAISVLTEPTFFLGANEYLTAIKKEVSIPILRKDFIIDEIQIYESRQIEADAILLICSILEPEQLKKYIGLADSLGLSVLVEAHDEAEVKTALAAGARMIGVNNRDLKTFEVDINNSIRLRKMVPETIIFVSESGIKTVQDVNNLKINGTNAVLIGETLMRSSNKKDELNKLRGI